MPRGSQPSSDNAARFSSQSLSQRPRWMLHATLLRGWLIEAPAYVAVQVPPPAILHKQMATKL
eukprot:11194207-Alexandrium_andersonii.AAC.1